jgi:hypothetical protein
MITTNQAKEEQLSHNDNHVFKSKYCKTVIYRIFCKDTNITDCYIGRTINFNSRKAGHKLSSRKSQLKVYRKIRECGGWNNWNMEIVNIFICKNKDEKKIKEQQYINYFKPTLNSISACSNKYEIGNIENIYNEIEIKQVELVCEFCKNTFNTVYSFNNHQKRATYCLQIQNKKEDKFICKYCNKTYTSKYYLNTHLENCFEKKMSYQKQMIIDKDNEISELKKQIEDLIEAHNMIMLEAHNMIIRLISKATNNTEELEYMSYSECRSAGTPTECPQ